MKNEKILIVEDEILIALDIKIIIEQLGYGEISVASNTQQAFEMIKKQKPDIAFLDVRLGNNNDGIEIAKKLKNHNTQIIFITASTDKNTYQKAQQIKPNKIIPKPYSSREIKRALAELTI